MLALWTLASGCSDDATTPRGVDIPPPSYGVQLRTPRFPVPAGEEVQHCYWFKLPSDVDLEVVAFQIRYLEGSHHMNLFQTDQDFDDHDAPCFTGVFSPMGTNGYDLIVGSQTGNFDWKLPDGVAFKLKARRQLMLQTHYVNAKTQAAPDGVGQVTVNLVAEKDTSKIRAHMGTMFANNVNVRIPPRASRAFTTSCTLPNDAHVAALTGHFHSRGKVFSVNLSPDGRTANEEIYRSRAWDEPPFRVLDTPRFIPGGGGLQYTCEFQNNGDEEIVFGPKVETNEHCNLFAYFYPSEGGGARYCF
jgi:hypothetical protein